MRKRGIILLFTIIISISLFACESTQNKLYDADINKSDLYGTWRVASIYPSGFKDFPVSETMVIDKKHFQELDLKLLDNEEYEKLLSEEDFDKNSIKTLKEYKITVENLGFKLENLNNRFVPIYYYRGVPDLNAGLDQSYILVDNGKYMIYTKNYNVYSDDKLEFGVLYKRVDI